ncbi:helix-turn-helix domain-containing protein [Streptomyces halobius]|uniref:Helix-turn-helix domain-containing protein n=1 Tax=Streptomyces halobius TaxID=2879846 RepID=A0ABY4MFU4_9ACTN|nr:helix-turn-helix domain-containing protein [Streptomyces halobius]UQA96666.1 helix-turn-helix domain-containing protein [Streptomyces halobius]
MINRLVLRTQDLPQRERFDGWLDLIDRGLTPAWLTTSHASDFRATASLLTLGPARFSALSLPPLRAERGWSLIRRGDPELWQLMLVVSGEVGVEQHGRRALVRPGELVVYDTSHPYRSRTFTNRGGTEVALLHLPRHEAPLPDRAVRALTARPIPTGAGAGALLGRYLEQLAGQTGDDWPEPDAARLGSAARDLAIVLLSGLARVDGLLAPETRDTALRLRVEGFIADNLASGWLTPGTIAEAHGISVRRLHQLFHQEGRSVAALVRSSRLERCRADLEEPGLAHLPVAAVGARWGFPDAAVFSRAFKDTYGRPPGAYRRHALGT